MSKKNIDDLRNLLFETIEGVRNNTLDIDKAKVIGDLSQVMVNSAKVEADFAKATGGNSSSFLGQGSAKALPDGITGITQHRIR